jgi:uncharacterized protein Smg (DUF494 family)
MVTREQIVPVREKKQTLTRIYKEDLDRLDKECKDILIRDYPEFASIRDKLTRPLMIHRIIDHYLQD